MIRFGMCGCGGFIEKAVLPRMRDVENARPVAAFDTSKECLERVCRDFDIARACTSYAELLSADNVDAVYIASPNVFHKEQVLAAAKAGKHVFCQKPMGLNAAECRDMVRTCRQCGVKLGVGFCYPFGGAQQRAKELIQEGVIGEVSHIHISFNLGTYTRETVGWRCDPKMSGGGPLMDLAPHLVNLACFFLDDKVESVMAYVRPGKTDTEIETDVAALLEFRRGARVSIDTSFLRRNTHNYAIVGTTGEIRAVGTMGWQAGGELSLHLADHEREDVPFPSVEHIEQELRLYCRAVEKDQEPPVPGEAGLHAQATIDAIYKSGRTGKRCAVEE